MTPEQRERLHITAVELRADAEHLREDDNCDGEADHNEAIAEAIDAAFKRIERLEKVLKLAQDALQSDADAYGRGYMNDLATRHIKAALAGLGEPPYC